MARGQFIVFEGGEGTGKSTQSRHLAENLTKHDVPVIHTREPGGTPAAEDIRSIFVAGAKDRWTPKSEILLITAARIDHLDRLIRPKLAEGVTVICDRFFDTSVAYQGYGNGLSVELITALHENFCDGVQPDLTVLMDAPVEKTLARSKARLAEEDSAEDRFEGFGMDFHRRVAQAYRDQQARSPERYLTVDAMLDMDEAENIILNNVLARLFRKSAA